jgi:hypothetical protein
MAGGWSYKNSSSWSSWRRKKYSGVSRLPSAVGSEVAVVQHAFGVLLEVWVAEMCNHVFMWNFRGREANAELAMPFACLKYGSCRRYGALYCGNVYSPRGRDRKTLQF